MMKRRVFNRLLGWSPLLAAAWNSYTPSVAAPEIVKPPPLKQGSRIGLIAPASPFPPKYLAKSVRNLRGLGLEVELGDHLMEEKGYLAGSDIDRLHDLHEMFERKDIDGIWCIRGGYGCTRLLPEIDYDLIRAHPKVFVGFSDITALHTAFFHKAGLISFHGPVASSTFSEYSTNFLKSVLFGGKNDRLTPAEEQVSDEISPFTIRKGTANGRLTGGNLSLFAALTGTDFIPPLKKKIVCLEEAGEDPYRIDRMLTQLRQGTDLDQANGIVLGNFKNCSPKKDASRTMSVRKTLEGCLGDLNIPISYGWDFGHIDRQFTLPIGLKVRMDTRKQTLQFLEAPIH